MGVSAAVDTVSFYLFVGFLVSCVVFGIPLVTIARMLLYPVLK